MNAQQLNKITMASMYIVAFLTLYNYFDGLYLALAIVYGWFFHMVGWHVIHHMMASHRAFEAKNRLVKILLLAYGSCIGIGSIILTSAEHRTHHADPDTELDPHSINVNPGIWHFIVLFFNQRFHWKVTQSMQDLKTDPDYKWFHDNYIWVLVAYAGILYAIDPVLFGYVWGVSGVYVLTVVGLTSTMSHWNEKPFGFNFSRPYNNPEDKNGYALNGNCKPLYILAPGFCQHNNHHQFPGAANNDQHKGEYDFSYWFIKLIGKNINEVRVETPGSEVATAPKKQMKTKDFHWSQFGESDENIDTQKVKKVKKIKKEVSK
jgi:fatty-acid desaturase